MDISHGELRATDPERIQLMFYPEQQVYIKRK
jgi:hypothetical protein